LRAASRRCLSVWIRNSLGERTAHWATKVKSTPTNVFLIGFAVSIQRFFYNSRRDYGCRNDGMRSKAGSSVGIAWNRGRSMAKVVITGIPDRCAPNMRIAGTVALGAADLFRSICG
jgi:hypothetical protein